MAVSETNNYIKYIANLAKLSLDDEEMQSLEEDMKDIIGLMDTIRDLDTDSVDATEHISQVTNNMREDNAGVPYDTEKIITNSKGAMENCFSIPKIIE